MPNRPIEAYTKVTLNLYASDVAAFKQRYGFGFSEQIRNVVHLNVQDWARQKRVMDLITEEPENPEDYDHV